MVKAEATEIPRVGRPALVARLFGWSMLAALVAFLINNLLVVWFDYPGVAVLWNGGGGAGAWLNVMVYAVFFVVSWVYVLSTRDVSLRWEALRVHGFNVYLVRALFWSVFLVGVVDVAVSFMRVESLLGVFVGDEFARNFTRPTWVGIYVHFPLVVAGFVIALFSRTLGFTWLTLMIVTAELGIVVSRFVFSYEQALMADLVRYWYAALFLFASAYTLFEDGHVRVDVLYAGFAQTKRGFFNAWGTILLGCSTAWVILYIGFNGKTSIINSPFSNFEVSQSGTSGMFVKYQMAMFLGIFAITMLIQFISYFFESVADWRDEPGRREAAPIVH
ncbi:TRAP transporter small permease subunit [Aquicoccus porphyridii]|uniref:TRAP transporter small permease protein n=1 Tax=Aquicoccus porphyridii TaxID=1852029 RepID=A0A5A9YZI9_9RHOB|nr:TRAP transporter small permease subunit [Aquicoccus porphyridii]KAA0910284.1 TRAP transporter small permease subunit [Aquicoccus porphyridii]RAI54427.1 permease [Rhodobacteraceae bacterium AsT-22]